MKTNSNRNLIDCVNYLISKSIITDEYASDRNGDKIATGGFKVSYAEHCIDIELSIQRLYEYDKSIMDSLLKEEFEIELNKNLRPFIESKSVATKNSLDLIINSIKEIPIKLFSVYREIKGISLNNVEKICKLGPFSIYHLASHKVHFSSELTHSLFLREKVPEFFVGVAFEVRGGGKAQEIADEMFQAFDDCIAFLINDPTQRMEVAILGYKGLRTMESFIFCENECISSSFKKNGAFHLVNLDDEYFHTETFNSIWRIIQAKSASGFHKQILLSIRWLGQALTEKSASVSFLKMTISLEILFTSSGGIFSPSLTSQIAENVAFIISDNLDTRLSIDAKLRELYSVRSKIAHYGNTNINNNDLLLLRGFASAAISKVLNNKFLMRLDTVAAFHLHLKRNRYSSPSLHQSLLSASVSNEQKSD